MRVLLTQQDLPSQFRHVGQMWVRQTERDANGLSHNKDAIPAIHESIDTELPRTDSAAHSTSLNGHTVKAGSSMVTYMAKNLVPSRVLHSFMRALKRGQKINKTCHTIIMRKDDVSHSQKPQDAANWREKLRPEVLRDASRTHILEKVPCGTYRKRPQVLTAHVHLTYSFVLVHAGSHGPGLLDLRYGARQVSDRAWPNRATGEFI